MSNRNNASICNLLYIQYHSITIKIEMKTDIGRSKSSLLVRPKFQVVSLVHAYYTYRYVFSCIASSSFGWYRMYCLLTGICLLYTSPSPRDS